MCTKNHNHMMYGSWEYRVRQRIFCHFGPFFAPLTICKIKILKKWKKQLEILLVYTSVPQIDDNHIWYRDMECNRQNFLAFWTVFFFGILDCFLLFYPLTTQKIKILKKLKKTPGDTIILHMCTKNLDIHL